MDPNRLVIVEYFGGITETCTWAEAIPKVVSGFVLSVKTADGLPTSNLRYQQVPPETQR